MECLGNLPAAMSDIDYGSAAAGIQIPISPVIFYPQTFCLANFRKRSFFCAPEDITF
jgi:hypothetical protein